MAIPLPYTILTGFLDQAFYFETLILIILVNTDDLDDSELLPASLDPDLSVETRLAAVRSVLESKAQEDTRRTQRNSQRNTRQSVAKMKGKYVNKVS